MKTEDYIQREDKYGAHNYHPLQVVISKGEGVYVWDVNDKKYFDEGWDDIECEGKKYIFKST